MDDYEIFYLMKIPTYKALRFLVLKFVPSFDCFTTLFTSVVIGLSDYFGFGFTTLN